MISPAVTILSLLASKIVLPVFAAIAVASSPANPETADIIISILSSKIKLLKSELPLIVMALFLDSVLNLLKDFSQLIYI
jgi:hypothetical protein